MPGQAFRPGDDVGGYRLEERVAVGAFGEVWRAHDPERDLAVAVKILKSTMSDNPEFRAIVAREGKALARLSDRPQVVDVFEYSIDGPVFLVMPFLEGPTLHDLVAEDGALSPARSVAVVDQVAEGLAAAHGQGLVHLDVTSANVLVGADDRVSLIDFGLVGAIGNPQLPSRTLFEEGFGNLRYMAPERLTRGWAPAVALDVFGLACVLYECLTGEAAFPQPKLRAVRRALLRARRPRPSDIDGRLVAFDDVVVAGLARDPADRIPTIPAFVAELRAATTTWAAGRDVSRR